MWSNYHTHSKYCDGKGGLQEYLTAAGENKIISLGFSSHAPVPFPCSWCMKKERFNDYMADIKSLKAREREIEIYAGVEVDFIPGIISPNEYKTVLDYTIGSIHFVDGFEGKPWEIDGAHEGFKEGLSKIFQNNLRGAITRYFELTREMVTQSTPDIVGHLDKIKIQNKMGTEFDESASWYRSEIDETLKVIKQANSIVEVNTRGLYQKKSAFTYPSPWILEKIFNLGIPITLSSDAHNKDDLINEFEKTAALLEGIGFKNLSILKRGAWREMPFNRHGFPPE